MTNCNQCDACKKLKWQLINAARNNDIDAAKEALKQGADVNAQDAAGRTPLHDAAMWGNLKIVELLIKEGADVNARDRCRWAPLHDAVDRGHTEVAKLLIDNGADVNARNRYGNTPLNWAAYRRNTEMVKLLIEKGADVNARNEDGRTPLHEAAKWGHTDIAELLQQYSKNNPSDYFMSIDKLMSDLGSVIRNYERKFRSGYLNNSDLENLHKSEKLLKEASELLINNFVRREQ